MIIYKRNGDIMSFKKFPDNFVFGAATSAYQIEGAHNADGRGMTMWDITNHDELGNPTGDVGDVSSDHYHLYLKDIALMKEIGIQSYRFSVSWVRIFPHGHGLLNQKGVDFYNNLINSLIENNIEPTITIWHGDLPLDYERIGGWKNKEVIEHYLEYANKLFSLYGDRVKCWFTHNEPWCAAFLNNETFSDQLQIAHHLMIAHAKAIQLYRKHQFGDGQIGIVLNLGKQYANTYDQLDTFAARNVDGFVNRWFLDPVLKGEYPEDMLELYGNNHHFFDYTKAEMTLLKTNKSDFLGINMYSRGIQKYNIDNQLFFAEDVKNPNAKFTDMGWEVCPESLYDLLMDIKEKYQNIPVIITENGGAFPDQNFEEKMVLDDDRVDYLKGHLTSVWKAIEHGCIVQGYYVWSLLDNFEWGLGYSKRFGIIRVDYKSLERSIKKSGFFYQNIIQNRGL